MKDQISAHQEQYQAFYTLNNILGLATEEGSTFTKGLKQLDEDIIGGLGYDLLNGVKYAGKVANTGLGILNMVSAGVNVFGAPIKKKGEALQNQLDVLGGVQFSQSEIALTGEIYTKENDGRVLGMYIPGRTENSTTSECNDNFYPAYNEVLGRFAVLDRPNVMWAMRVGETSLETNPGKPFNFISLREDTFMLRFNGVLPYRFNPAANLNEQETELYAALQFKVPKIQNAGNLVSPSVANNTAFKVFEDDTHILYQTRMMPLSCLTEFSAAVVYRFEGKAACGDFQPCNPTALEVNSSFGERTEARLKIVANFVFDGLNSFGEAPQALQIYTYKTNLYQDGSQDYPVLDYPNDIVFDNDIVFQNDTTIFAWNSVEIGASLSTANPNVQVEIIAPNIEMVLNSSVAPEISLFNKDFPVTCTPIQEYPDSLMAEFCSSNSFL